MKVYFDFFNTNEGKMATLKSYRVSNSYLCKLVCGLFPRLILNLKAVNLTNAFFIYPLKAIKKLLNEYIVSENFSARENWIPPFYARSDEESDLRLKLSDKSLADCIEALIGLYLIHLGVNGAKSFMQWLDFTISDKEGNANFLDQKKQELPDPLRIKFDGKTVSKLENKYAEFEKQIGYEFNNKAYIYQAFTHPSDVKNMHTSSYQK